MRNRSEYFKAFMQEFQYPAEAVDFLLASYNKILENEEAGLLFDQCIAIYENQWMWNYEAIRGKMSTVAGAVNIPVETAEFLMLIAMSEHMKELYIERGIDLKIYHDSCMDFKAKLLSCKRNKDIWGTYVGSWFNRWFDLTRFAFGRLQFEIIYAWATAEGTYKTVSAGQAVVNMHIPALGPLLYDDCRDSFLRAYEFFKPLFPDGAVPFFCASWIISPQHEFMLGPDSNLRKFMKFFKITESQTTVEKALNEYVFGPVDLTDVDALPEDTSMQRAYKKVMKEGEMPHGGVGVFHIKDGEFI